MHMSGFQVETLLKRERRSHEALKIRVKKSWHCQCIKSSWAYASIWVWREWYRFSSNLCQVKNVLNVIAMPSVNFYLLDCDSLYSNCECAKTQWATASTHMIAHNKIDTRDTHAVSRNLGICTGLVLNYYRWHTACLLSTHNIIKTDSTECCKDNVFEIISKSNEENLLDIVQEIQEIVQNAIDLLEHLSNPSLATMSKACQFIIEFHEEKSFLRVIIQWHDFQFGGWKLYKMSLIWINHLRGWLLNEKFFLTHYPSL